MRLALATLIAAGTFGAAVAQDAAQPAPAAPPAAVTPPPVAPAPAQPAADSPAAGTPATAPADAASPPVPAPAAPAAPAAPVDPAAPAPPAAAPAPAPAPAPAEPLTFAAPTDPTSIAIINVLEKVCVPAVVGGDFQAIVKANGFKKKRDGWVLPMAKPYQIAIANPGSNKNVCSLTIDYPVDTAQTLVTDLHAWAQQRQPFLQQYRNDVRNDPDFRRTTVSWEHVGQGTASTGLVFVGLKKTDGSSLVKNADQATLLYSVRP